MPADVRISVPALSQPGAGERVGPGRVAVDGVDPLLPQLAQRIDVQLDHGRHDVVLAQQADHGPPGRAIADDHGPVARVGGRSRWRGVAPPARRSSGIEEPRERRPRRHPAIHRLDRAVEQRIEDDRHDRGGHQRVGCRDGEDPEVAPDAGQDERELADLAEGDGDGQRRLERSSRARGPSAARSAACRSARPRASRRSAPAPRAGSRDRAASRPRRRTAPRRRRASAAPRRRPSRLNSDRPTTMPGQERAQRHRDAEHHRRPDRDAQRQDQHGEREQLARPRARPRARAAGGSRRAPTSAVNATSARDLHAR